MFAVLWPGRINFITRILFLWKIYMWIASTQRDAHTWTQRIITFFHISSRFYSLNPKQKNRSLTGSHSNAQVSFNPFARHLPIEEITQWKNKHGGKEPSIGYISDPVHICCNTYFCGTASSFRIWTYDRTLLPENTISNTIKLLGHPCLRVV